MNEKKMFLGYMTALGCLIVMFIHMGALQTIGVFIPAIAADFSSIAGIGYMIIFANASGFLLSLIASKVINKLSPKLTLLICSFLCAGHFFIYSISQSVVHLYIGAAIGGFTIAWGTHSCIAAIIQSWFIEKRGTMIGIVFGGAGFGAAFTCFLAGQLMTIFNWRVAYRILALIVLVIAVVANLALIRDPKKMGCKPFGWEKEKALEEAAAKKAANAQGIMRKEAIRTPAFWCLCIGLFLSAFMLTGFSNYAPAFWQSRGTEAVVTSN